MICVVPIYTYIVVLCYSVAQYDKISKNVLPKILWYMSTQTKASIREKNKVAQNEKCKKKLRGFSYSKSMANFEAFCWNISSSINLLFLKSASARYQKRGLKRLNKISIFSSRICVWLKLTDLQPHTSHQKNQKSVEVSNELHIDYSIQHIAASAEQFSKLG